MIVCLFVAVAALNEQGFEFIRRCLDELENRGMCVVTTVYHYGEKLWWIVKLANSTTSPRKCNLTIFESLCL